MQFRLSTLFLLFVVLASSLAVFGIGGIAVFILVLLVAICIIRPVWLLALLGFLFLVALLLPAVSSARAAARRSICRNNLRQMAIALNDYRQANGAFPPAYIADEDGRPMHSWRVLILPYLGEEALYKYYDFNEPWDGPNNRKLLASRPAVYTCPADDVTRDSGAPSTNYIAVVGANAIWSADGTPKDLSGEHSATVMLVEIADANIAWTEPRDLSLDELVAGFPGALKVSSRHYCDDGFFTYILESGANVAFADGSVRFLFPELVASDKLLDLLRVGGVQAEDRESWDVGANLPDVPRRIHWPNCIAFTVWLASSGLLMVRAVRSRRKKGTASQDGTVEAEPKDVGV